MRNTDKPIYEVVKDIAVLSESGYTSKRLRLVSYNGAAPKLDVRTWKIFPQDGTQNICRGVTLTTEEAIALRDALTEYLSAS